MERLMNIDRRLIWGLLFVALSIPLIKPLGLPLSIGAQTQSVYDYVEALPSGSKVFLSMDTDPSAQGEIGPGSIALFNHLAKKGMKVYAVGFNPGGPNFFEALAQQSLLAGKEYGTDWVNLGYLAGGQAALAAMAKDIPGAYPNDFRGNVTTSLPIMEGLVDVKSIALAISITSSDGFRWWIQQVGDPYGVPLATMCNMVDAPQIMPLVQSKQLLGVIAGLRGGAEYEKLVQVLGLGSAGMDAQSVAHMLVLVLVALGNIGHLLSRPAKGAKS